MENNGQGCQEEPGEGGGTREGFLLSITFRQSLHSKYILIELKLERVESEEVIQGEEKHE